METDIKKSKEEAKFVLSTDTSCDVFRKTLDGISVKWLPLTFTVNGTVYDDDFTSDAQYIDFYKKIRGGAMPTTSQINIFNHEEFFKRIIDGGATEIVHLSLSGGLSSTSSSAKIAAENVTGAHPGCKIYVVDTLSATQGHRYLLDEAVILRDSGADAGSAAERITDLAQRLHHWIVVDDLMHLKRGGRVSGPSAYIGSLLKVKPVLIINNEGKLAVVKKAVGTAKAYAYVIEMIKQYADTTGSLKIYLASADAKDKVSEMKTLLKQEFHSVEICDGWIGPVIGAHTGAGTLGIVFPAKERLTNK